ncbi:hypothetical protein [Pseudorhodoferax sp. Leaf267]|uniref:hypothetical protein n=1 Tax=Pseudorhodoferax sp. Leaf267 TaxID=1736316 RepID=UPI0012E31FB7|nr:hypothetical protein [Pseudorhodoferax sp. Leaf267]
MSDRARAIATALETVPRSFQSPLENGVDAQLLDWGTRALKTADQGLEGAYVRHLGRFGVHVTHVVGLEHTYALAHATVANLVRRYLWALRNVPAKRPDQPTTAIPMPVIIHNNGTIGSLQTGAGSLAYVQQAWGDGEKIALLAGLANLRDSLDRAQDVAPDLRAELIADVDKASVELQQETPNKGRLLRWLGGIGAVIGTVGSVQPAYEAVKDLARALGLSI